MYCYIHIPFCESKCSYCRFASIGSLDKIKIDFYTKSLVSEIKESRVSTKKLRTIYFGGGTPSVLSKNQLTIIIKTLEEKFGFYKNIEINLETTPQNISQVNINFWKKLGINRISMGIQSLNEKALQEIGRKGAKEIYDALDILKTSKINNISVDFIIGLPYVEKGLIKKYIKKILREYPFIKHVSVYMLEDYYEVGETDDSKYENITYPSDWAKNGLSEEDFSEEYSDVKKYLENKGYARYEISNFSKKGYECKHNKAYWEHKEVAAFGLGASGLINSTRYTNSEDFKSYYARENIFSERLTERDYILEKLMFGLRTTGINKDLSKNLNKNSLDNLLKNGYLKKSKNKITLSKNGTTLLDTIVVDLLK